MSLWATTLTVTAPGYNDGTSNVTVVPSGFYIGSPTMINTTISAGNTNVNIVAGRLDPTTLNVVTWQYLRGGMTASVDVTSSDTGVGTITTSPVVLNGSDYYQTTQFDPQTAGISTISVGTPTGFDTSSNYQQITATVDP